MKHLSFYQFIPFENGVGYSDLYREKQFVSRAAAAEFAAMLLHTTPAYKSIVITEYKHLTKKQSQAGTDVHYQWEIIRSR